MYKHTFFPCFIAIGMVALLVTAGQAEVVIEYVPVGNQGNAADDTNYGNVEYNYQIGKYEVTASQYTEFLNAKAVDGDPHGLYNDNMMGHGFGCKIEKVLIPDPNDPFNELTTYVVAEDRANRPVNMVNFWDACRFVNWLHNGQGDGDTETGAYTMDSFAISANTVTRNLDAQVWIPSENEWYKAAYHQNDGVTANYFDFPCGSDLTVSHLLVDPDPGNNATCWDGNFPAGEQYTIGNPYYFTEVGDHENSDSPYGTFDQAGNVREWTEAAFETDRIIRGGAVNWWPANNSVTTKSNLPPDSEDPNGPNWHNNIGFRVATVAGSIPDDIPGDADGNGVVDDEDAKALAQNWGNSGASWAMGDFDADGVVGPKDASIMAANWGHGTSEATVVPEPSSLLLVLLGCFVTLTGMRRSR